MKKILFPTDFSEKAAEAFKFAADLAYFFKAQLILVHVISKPNTSDQEEALEHMAGVVVDQMVDLVNNNLLEGYKENMQIEYSAKIGQPSNAILNLALEEDIDLIVMGTTGKSNRTETILGSVSLKVLDQADCPVLLIPRKAVYSGIDNIAFTSNFEFRDLGGLSFLKKWSRAFEANLNILHIVEANEDPIVAAYNMSILIGTFKRQKRISFHLDEGSFYEAIEDFSKRKKIDILAMMAHKRNFISRLLDKNNTVKQMARIGIVPLLVIKDNAYEVNTEAASWVDLFNSIA